MEIALAWWNTSLSPTFRERDLSTEIEQNTVSSIVSLLTGANGFDLVALCEVSPADIDRLQEACDLSRYSVYLATEQAGRSAFDMCVLYRPEKFSLLDKKAIVSRSGNQLSRVAQHLTFAVAGEVIPFHIFISHWPSRLSLQQHEPGRHLLGTRLRDALDEIQSLDECARIILLGDYNDEPFDVSVSERLLASRDKELVKRRKHLLYNPFWRHLASFGYFSETDISHDRGSYYHKGGDITLWRTFDQMMFSSAFVGDEGWTLNEGNTRILDIPNYTALVKNNKARFDHLPIVGYIEKRM